MKIKRLYSCNTSFLDLLFNMLLAFTALFVLAFASMNQNKKMPEAKGAYIITVTWPQDFNDDIDTYVQDPEGKLVFFGRREDGLMHLDRDDLGHSNDKVQTQFGIIEYKENREVVTLRGTSPGEYCVNIHVYRRNNSEDKRPVEVMVQLDKITPSYLPIVQKKVIVTQNGEEKTMFRFKVDAKENIVSLSYDPKSLIRTAQGQPNGPVIPGAGPDAGDFNLNNQPDQPNNP